MARRFHLPLFLTIVAASLCFKMLADQAYCERSWLQTQRIPLLNALGKITYGIYSLDALAGYSTAYPGNFRFYVVAVSLLVIVCSLASYRWMERPLLRWKEQMRP